MKSIKKSINKNKERIAKALEIPTDAFLGDAVLTLTGSNEVLIGNYKGIVEYKDKYIRILTNNGLIEIIGDQFHIAYLTKDEIKVVGNIKDIKY